MEAFLNIKKKIIILTAAIFILTMFVGYNFVYLSGVKWAQQLKFNIKELENASVLLKEIKGLNDKITVYLNKSLDSPDPSMFISRVSDIAHECGVSIDSLNIGNSTSDGEYTFLSCKIGFVVSYRRLKFFINKLENDKKFIRIDSLSVIPIGKETKKDQAQQLVNTNKFAERFGKSLIAVGEIVKKNDQEGVLVNVIMDLTGIYSK